MTDPRFYTYYDSIYCGKDYQGEVAVLLNVYMALKGTPPSSVLDVGCGTGTHSCYIARNVKKVVGIDVDQNAIRIAQGKARLMTEPGPVFLCGDVHCLDSGRFDMAISLFNVINYIGETGYLARFLSSISDRLVDAGILVFDCWNGVAAILDPPRRKTTEVVANGRRIIICTIPHIDLMSFTVDVSNVVTVESAGRVVDEFEYSYTQYLWTPHCLTGLLKEAGLETIGVSPTMKPEMRANANTWKIMYVCRKRPYLLSHGS